jgi:hypothetical protein
VDELVFEQNLTQTQEKFCSFAQIEPAVLCSRKVGFRKEAQTIMNEKFFSGPDKK